MAAELGQLWLPPMALKDARVKISAGVWHWACSHLGTRKGPKLLCKVCIFFLFILPAWRYDPDFCVI